MTIDYDAELRLYNEPLHRAWNLRRDDHVLDVGCGTGQTTRDAARTAGSALGVDISEISVQNARRLASADGLTNISFEVGDAQAYDFGPARFTIATSRFGTMFFADPVAAFANIGRALVPGGRLAMIVWQAAERNAWDVALREAFGPTLDGPEPFSLADPRAAGAILQTAGFGDVAFTGVERPVCYGPDLDAAVRFVRGFSCAQAATPHSLATLREKLAAHLTDDGVWFDSRAWLVTARRAPRRGY
ncbi:class I SAM-dependent methyltransferase [Actinoplanes sp. NPDC051513]|uniref:class I SAM-dependent methyltransferase n=1 Tax=Actinoplanes sp. NPDC051513 TaxID=3363908 RepID=UPI0037A4E7C2